MKVSITFAGEYSYITIYTQSKYHAVVVWTQFDWHSFQATHLVDWKCVLVIGGELSVARELILTLLQQWLVES